MCHWRRLSSLLMTYEKALGQRLNREKRAIFVFLFLVEMPI
jgi:uncharacterized membrane protein